MSFDIITNASKDDVVAHLSNNCVEHELIGNILWVVREDILSAGDIGNVIICFSLDDSEYGWGYKEIPECDQPFYYNCPLRFLTLAPVACKAWRERVCKHHKTHQ